MSNINWSYIAGFFDGDGSLTLVRNKDSNNNCWRARLHQGTLPVLQEIQQFLERHGIISHIQLTQTKGKKHKHGPYRANSDMHCVQISTKREYVRGFLQGILPYLIVKKVLVQDVLRFLKLYPKLHRCTHKLNDSQLSTNSRMAAGYE